MAYVEEVHNDQATDTFESCYSDTKRAVAVAAGYQIFDEIDTNKDGTLTLEEVNSFFDRNPDTLKKLAEIKTTNFEKDWVHMLDMLDEDGNKKVDADEFADFWNSNSLGTDEEGREIFSTIDKSGDGELSTHEVKSYLQSNTALRKKLGVAKAQKINREWDAFFAMMQDGTSGEFDRAQFASLWAASGLGLNVTKRSDSNQAPKPPQKKQNGREEIVKRAPFRPTPPSPRKGGRQPSVRSYPKRSGYSGDSYLLLSTADLERPCVARKIDYAGLIADQNENLVQRDDDIKSYKNMLLKVEEYQKRALKILEAHYGALNANERWKAIKTTTKVASTLPPIKSG
eukprot:TRINITY_DN7652_c0_g1_i2.p1 TRINITY_DN7652_c0_g1~~TRINITY_DN7652_c0_g1_i2.p1  ORF type:complete len:389 (+),score=89.29 TRINITY_DN7652_c0_g1_i2:143-1168(+)